MKAKLYGELISRMEAAEREGRYLEAAWYAYAVLEDRLRSMLRQSGGEEYVDRDGQTKTIMMMGPKRKELKKRSKTDALLAAYFENKRLEKWIKDRNKLMHAMASGSFDLVHIDSMINLVAKEAVSLAREYAVAARKLKKHREKVSIQPKK